MNQDIEKWIKYMNSTNSTDKKRKRDKDDELLNEMICMSIENLTTIIKDNDVPAKKIGSFLQNVKKSLSNTRNMLEEDDVLSNELSRSENKSMRLLIRASISTSIDTINKIQSEKKIQGKEFNVIKWLNAYKKQYNVPIKNRKLQPIGINFNNNNILCSTKETDDEEDDDEDDEDYEIEDVEEEDMEEEEEDEEEDYPEHPKNGSVSNFINQLKQISNGNTNSKEEIVNYFNSMDKLNQTTTMSSLNELNSTTNKIPALFRILSTPITDATKRSLISKMLNVSSGLNENGKAKKWLEDALKIPFGINKGIDIDETLSNKPNKVKKFLNRMKEKMNSAVWGHDNAKKEILQIIAQQVRNPSCKGNIIGLWGSPGNGKTSLIKHGIAEAMDKPFVFISLGGATDASFLEGHSFTYEGSIYGRIAQAIIESKCMNPIIYFDELDKVSTTAKGEEIINLLIHLTDPVQNHLFRDKYFYDIDFDLSKVTFIFSFNDPSVINYVLKDRITMIETKHLTLEQKLYIGANYLMPEILKDSGMKLDSITIPDTIMTRIINDYTNEGGVRGLKKNLYSIVRELNVANLTNSTLGETTITFPLVYSKVLYDLHYHGKQPFNPMTIHKVDGVGMVNGLWANSLGVGGVLPIETVLIPTNEMMGVKATGSLGNVIKESIDVAISVAWNWLDQETKNKWMKKWKIRPERFHVHCPDGSTNKEGPSAGAAMSLAFYSRLTNRTICHTIAMTGEINLRGEVSEIGGLEEKLNAAKRAGAKLVLVPHENETDLIEIKKRYPSLIDDAFQIKCVKNFDDVLRYSLL
jgi:endopeptidase La